MGITSYLEKLKLGNGSSLLVIKDNRLAGEIAYATVYLKKRHQQYAHTADLLRYYSRLSNQASLSEKLIILAEYLSSPHKQHTKQFVIEYILHLLRQPPLNAYAIHQGTFSLTEHLTCLTNALLQYNMDIYNHNLTKRYTAAFLVKAKANNLTPFSIKALAISEAQVYLPTRVTLPSRPQEHTLTLTKELEKNGILQLDFSANFQSISTKKLPFKQFKYGSTTRLCDNNLHPVEDMMQYIQWITSATATTLYLLPAKKDIPPLIVAKGTSTQNKSNGETRYKLYLPYLDENQNLMMKEFSPLVVNKTTSIEKDAEESVEKISFEFCFMLNQTAKILTTDFTEQVATVKLADMPLRQLKIEDILQKLQTSENSPSSTASNVSKKTPAQLFRKALNKTLHLKQETIAKSMLDNIKQTILQKTWHEKVTGKMFGRGTLFAPSAAHISPYRVPKHIGQILKRIDDYQKNSNESAIAALAEIKTIAQHALYKHPILTTIVNTFKKMGIDISLRHTETQIFYENLFR